MTAEVTSRGKLFHIYSRCSDAENEICSRCFILPPKIAQLCGEVPCRVRAVDAHRFSASVIRSWLRVVSVALTRASRRDALPSYRLALPPPTLARPPAVRYVFLFSDAETAEARSITTLPSRSAFLLIVVSRRFAREVHLCHRLLYRSLQRYRRLQLYYREK